MNAKRYDLINPKGDNENKVWYGEENLFGNNSGGVILLLENWCLKSVEMAAFSKETLLNKSSNSAKR